jgi:hypothetical protein
MYRLLLDAERQASKERNLRELHPLLAAKPVIDFEAELITHMHLNYARFIREGILTRDVKNGGNLDAFLNAVATALQFVTTEELNGPVFAELCRLNERRVVLLIKED